MKNSVIISAMTALSLLTTPVTAAEPFNAGNGTSAPVEMTAHHGDKKAKRHRSGRRHHSEYRHHDRYDRDHDYRNRDRRHHDRYRNDCRHDDGTAGLLIGGAVGGAIGHEVAGEGDKTAGTLLGAAGGALIGKNIDDGYKCR